VSVRGREGYSLEISSLASLRTRKRQSPPGDDRLRPYGETGLSIVLGAGEGSGGSDAAWR
jgi:hypothetical protein